MTKSMVFTALFVFGLAFVSLSRVNTLHATTNASPAAAADGDTAAAAPQPKC